MARARTALNNLWTSETQPAVGQPAISNLLIGDRLQRAAQELVQLPLPPLPQNSERLRERLAELKERETEIEFESLFAARDLLSGRNFGAVTELYDRHWHDRSPDGVRAMLDGLRDYPELLDMYRRVRQIREEIAQHPLEAALEARRQIVENYLRTLATSLGLPTPRLYGSDLYDSVDASYDNGRIFFNDRLLERQPPHDAVASILREFVRFEEDVLRIRRLADLANIATTASPEQVRQLAVQYMQSTNAEVSETFVGQVLQVRAGGRLNDGQARQADNLITSLKTKIEFDRTRNAIENVERTINLLQQGYPSVIIFGDGAPERRLCQLLGLSQLTPQLRSALNTVCAAPQTTDRQTGAVNLLLQHMQERKDALQREQNRLAQNLDQQTDAERVQERTSYFPSRTNDPTEPPGSRRGIRRSIGRDSAGDSPPPEGDGPQSNAQPPRRTVRLVLEQIRPGEGLPQEIISDRLAELGLARVPGSTLRHGIYLCEGRTDDEGFFAALDQINSLGWRLRLGDPASTLSPADLAQNPSNPRGIRTSAVHVQITSQNDLLRIITEFPNLASLELSFNTPGSTTAEEYRQAIAHLQSLTQLQQLRISSCGRSIGAPALAEIGSLARLEHLDLSQCRGVDNTTIGGLCNLTRLSHLNLSGAHISDAGVNRLRSLTNLQHLNLCWNTVTDAGVNQLRSLTNLQHLDLSHSRALTNNAIASLSQLSNLRHLDLSFCRLVTDINQLRALPNLEQLNLERTHVNDDGIAHLRSLHRLQSLNLAATSITSAGFAHLRELRHLRRLDISDIYEGINDDGLRHLRPLAQLEHLSLASTGITDAGLIHLGALPRLQTLDLSGTRITGAGLRNLALSPELCRNLHELQLQRCHNVNSGLVHLGPMQALRSLDLRECQNLPEHELAHLRRLPELQELYLPGRRVSDYGLALLRGSPRLARLEIAGSGVTNTGLVHLRSIPNLHTLDLSYCSRISDQAIYNLLFLRNLRTLSITSTSISSNGIRRLRQSIPNAVDNRFGGGN